MSYSFMDAQENTWFIGIGVPKPTLAMNEGEKVYGWVVSIVAPDGSSVEHQHHNLAEAIAQAVAKADWLRK
jgi:hypothetical protein